MNVPITLGCGLYDRTAALALGQVRPSGVDLTYLPMHPEEAFWRMTRHAEFDASEMSMSSYMIRRSRGDDALVAIPVFPSRMFRQSCVWINADSGIERAEDLKGRKVGVPEYQVTAAVWIRGFLEDDYGVKPSDVRWYQGGVYQPGRVEKLAIDIPGVEITPIGPDQTLSAMIADGEIDAMIGPRAPSTLDGVRVKRLFPDFREVEADYFRRTGIFPIMHAIAIRKTVLERYPWVARSLYDAFLEAKAWTMHELEQPVALHATLPWLLAELEATKDVMGEDFWPYGVEPNRKTLEALVRYDFSQGLTARQLAVEELFAESTLDDTRI